MSSNKKRYVSMPNFDDGGEPEHLRGCWGCENNRLNLLLPEHVIDCKIYQGSITQVNDGCARHICENCPPSALIAEKTVQLQIVKVQKTLGEI